MTKLEIESIRVLPQDYVSDDTAILEVHGREKYIIAMNPLLKPIIFSETSMAWAPIGMSESDRPRCQQAWNPQSID